MGEWMFSPYLGTLRAIEDAKRAFHERRAGKDKEIRGRGMIPLGASFIPLHSNTRRDHLERLFRRKILTPGRKA